LLSCMLEFSIGAYLPALRSFSEEWVAIDPCLTAGRCGSFYFKINQM